MSTEPARRFEQNRLAIERTDSASAITLRFSGKSVDRKPADFITPILLDALRDAGDSGRGIILDFRELAYMNSSTITPIIKVLERAKCGENRLEVRYDSTLKWQSVNFTALKIFETPDGRVRVRGVD